MTIRATVRQRILDTEAERARVLDKEQDYRWLECSKSGALDWRRYDPETAVCTIGCLALVGGPYIDHLIDDEQPRATSEEAILHALDMLYVGYFDDEPKYTHLDEDAEGVTPKGREWLEIAKALAFVAVLLTVVLGSVILVGEWLIR